MLPDRKDMVVPYSIFHVGCGGVIINDGSILLIEEKRVCVVLCRESSREDTAFLEDEPTLEREYRNVQSDKFLNKSE